MPILKASCDRCGVVVDHVVYENCRGLWICKKCNIYYDIKYLEGDLKDEEARMLKVTQDIDDIKKEISLLKDELGSLENDEK